MGESLEGGDVTETYDQIITSEEQAASVKAALIVDPTMCPC